MKDGKLKCTRCGCWLAEDNRTDLCSPCHKNGEEHTAFARENRHYDLRQIQDLLGLVSYEQVRRKAKAGQIPGKVPGIKRHLFDREKVDEWLRSGTYADVGKSKTWTLSPGTLETLGMLSEFVSVVEQRVPVGQVISELEQRLPIQEVAEKLGHFIRHAPPPDQVVGELVRVLRRDSCSD